MHADFLKLEHSEAAIDVNEHLGNLAKDDIRHESLFAIEELSLLAQGVQDGEVLCNVPPCRLAQVCPKSSTPQPPSVKTTAGRSEPAPGPTAISLSSSVESVRLEMLAPKSFVDSRCYKKAARKGRPSYMAKGRRTKDVSITHQRARAVLQPHLCIYPLALRVSTPALHPCRGEEEGCHNSWPYTHQPASLTARRCNGAKCWWRAFADGKRGAEWVWARSRLRAVAVVVALAQEGCEGNSWGVKPHRGDAVLQGQSAAQSRESSTGHAYQQVSEGAKTAVTDSGTSQVKHSSSFRHPILSARSRSRPHPGPVASSRNDAIFVHNACNTIRRACNEDAGSFIREDGLQLCAGSWPARLPLPLETPSPCRLLAAHTPLEGRHKELQDVHQASLAGARDPEGRAGGSPRPPEPTREQREHRPARKTKDPWKVSWDRRTLLAQRTYLVSHTLSQSRAGTHELLRSCTAYSQSKDNQTHGSPPELLTREGAGASPELTPDQPAWLIQSCPPAAAAETILKARPWETTRKHSLILLVVFTDTTTPKGWSLLCASPRCVLRGCAKPCEMWSHSRRSNSVHECSKRQRSGHGEHGSERPCGMEPSLGTPRVGTEREVPAQQQRSLCVFIRLTERKRGGEKAKRRREGSTRRVRTGLEVSDAGPSHMHKTHQEDAELQTSSKERPLLQRRKFIRYSDEAGLKRVNAIGQTSLTTPALPSSQRSATVCGWALAAAPPGALTPPLLLRAGFCEGSWLITPAIKRSSDRTRTATVDRRSLRSRGILDQHALEPAQFINPVTCLYSHRVPFKTPPNRQASRLLISNYAGSQRARSFAAVSQWSSMERCQLTRAELQQHPDKTKPTLTLVVPALGSSQTESPETCVRGASCRKHLGGRGLCSDHLSASRCLRSAHDGPPADPAGFHKLVTATPAPRMPFSIHLLTSATPGAGESGCQERETKPQMPAGGQRNTSLEQRQNASSWTCEGGQERHALKSEQEKLVKAVEERRIKYVIYRLKGEVRHDGSNPHRPNDPILATYDLCKYKIIYPLLPINPGAFRVTEPSGATSLGRHKHPLQGSSSTPCAESPGTGLSANHLHAGGKQPVKMRRKREGEAPGRKRNSAAGRGKAAGEAEEEVGRRGIRTKAKFSYTSSRRQKNRVLGLHSLCCWARTKGLGVQQPFLYLSKTQDSPRGFQITPCNELYVEGSPHFGHLMTVAASSCMINAGFQITPCNELYVEVPALQAGFTSRALKRCPAGIRSGTLSALFKPYCTPECHKKLCAERQNRPEMLYSRVLVRYFLPLSIYGRFRMQAARDRNQHPSCKRPLIIYSSIQAALSFIITLLEIAEGLPGLPEMSQGHFFSSLQFVTMHLTELRGRPLPFMGDNASSADTLQQGVEAKAGFIPWRPGSPEQREDLRADGAATSSISPAKGPAAAGWSRVSIIRGSERCAAIKKGSCVPLSPAEPTGRDPSARAEPTAAALSSAATDYGLVSRAFEHQGPHVSTQFVLCITFISLSVVYVKHLLRIKSNNIGVATTAIIYDEA
ncbi:hypothetical protein Anapl_16402 [Anas platyrhynchos]|uniref:Uncharacterized protein n=1 Tax=Anas platyrhynchos TaxID=8839 RepID=R0KYC0_ANAPL|nr:hypothetical protein Anapl_16402 [Anas platyrhynchos]